MEEEGQQQPPTKQHSALDILLDLDKQAADLKAHNTKLIPQMTTSYVPTGLAPRFNLPDCRHLPPSLSLPTASSHLGLPRLHSDVSTQFLCSSWQL